MRGKIVYVLGFLPTYVLAEILELASRGLRIHVFLPDSESISSHWLEMVDTCGLPENVIVEKSIPVELFRCPIRKLLPSAARMCAPLFLRNPVRFIRNLMSALRMRSFRFFVVGSFLAGRMTEYPALFHSHFARTVAFSAMWAAKLLGRPFTVTTHAVDIFLPRRERLVKRLLERADGIFTISGFNEDYMYRRFGESLRGKVRMIHLGIDHDSLPERNPTGGVPLVICTASGLGEKKGVPVLLEACGILKTRGIRFRCRVIGADAGGFLLEKYRREVREAGLADVVEFTGAMKSGDVLREVASASVFVLPSMVSAAGDMDGIPVALMESMAMGIPTVSTRLSGIPELVDDGKNGLLVTPGDSEELADALERMLTDADFARVMGAAGAVKAGREFEVSGYVSGLLDHWSRLACRE